eukprot:jgi/Botrbrau1/14837/Bobra.0278s0007.1
MASYEGFDAGQAKKAVAALLKHANKGKQDHRQTLIDEDEFLYLGIQLKTTPHGPKKHKPVCLPVPHSLYSFDGAEICLIVKDHKGEGHKEAKQRVKEEKIARVSKVIGVSKLRTTYESFEAKRKLCTDFDLFLADNRILPSLPKLIGKTFFKKKKQPIPVDLRRKEWGEEVQRALNATYMFLGHGSCLTIRFARSSFTEKQCAENLVAVLRAAVPHLPKKWSNVQNLFIKTANSVALPFYQSLPGADKLAIDNPMPDAQPEIAA